jgi:cytochrome c-type biogenesis protein CcmH/NrfG
MSNAWANATATSGRVNREQEEMMIRQPVFVAGGAEATELRHELLGRLGLRANASDQELEAAHYELVDFLELAPPEMKSWADARTIDVEELFARLSGTEQDPVSPPAQILTTALDEADDRFTTSPFSVSPARTERSPGRTLVRWAMLPLLAAIILGVYWSGKDSPVPATSATPTSSATQASGAPTPVPVDQAKVAGLMGKISANPKDIASLQSLADVYFAAADYANASTWEQKILAFDPKNQEALVALGASQFNSGNAAEAKKAWLVAARLYPKTAEVHYDLGFLYSRQTPPDTVNMTAEWNKVIAIDPTSEFAKSVAPRLSSATPTPSGK